MLPARAHCPALLIALALPPHAGAQIRVDGRLDEPEWAQALVFTDFRVTQPYTLTEPSHRTEARLLSTPEGISVAIVNEHPPGVPRLKPRTERDQRRPSDRVNFIIDFDADGRVAYDFAVLLSGSIQDDIITNQTQFNSDWDGDWSWAVHEEEDRWTVEMLIPWSVAPMRNTHTPTRTVAVYFDRVLGHSDERSAFPQASFDRGRFVADLHRIEIPQYRAAILHVFPYATVLHDRIAGDGDFKAGVDLFWKPSGGFQLSATLNPDFGQVEADELVVNFDAIETFFTDKRPFFTENQGFFDLRTPDAGQLVYTRRIGARGDDGAPAADIDGALKLNGSLGHTSYGLIAAQEADAAGRRFGVARLFREFGAGLGLGWLGTWTDRPFLGRTARVHSADIGWHASDKLLVNGQLILSEVEQAGDTRRGHGAWVRMNWAPDARWQHRLEATHFDRHLDFNDLGFQRRASLAELRLASEYLHRVAAPASRLRSTRWRADLQARYNDEGDRLPGTLTLQHSSDFHSGASLQFEAGLHGAGIDDLISRGNGPWRRPARQTLFARWRTPVRNGLQLSLRGTLYQEGLAGYAFDPRLEATWFVTDDLNLQLQTGPLWSRDWLIWRQDVEFGRYRRRNDFAALNLNWFPGDRHELRVKAQWLAVTARDGERHLLGDDGHLRATATPLPDFVVNSFGLQLRYRYQFSRWSELYLVWSRGGTLDTERDPRGPLDLFDEALSLRDADQFLVKFRHRF
ncbi:DUF5916 domain-containing protein [Rehaibacterium terrae]|uniref:DUF5916 domain-containing protein n=1 Tax=Rehaibacterium terrae TaxID=1341696 RepID=A0A7W7Y0W2_9GAMM|nr:DUF5916 domain-containing protein [Rehaibacterium terrae]MBB5016047.1 hypothetical protein [Rehaibacterium terrae]